MEEELDDVGLTSELLENRKEAIAVVPRAFARGQDRPTPLKGFQCVRFLRKKKKKKRKK